MLWSVPRRTVAVLSQGSSHTVPLSWVRCFFRIWAESWPCLWLLTILSNLQALLWCFPHPVVVLERHRQDFFSDYIHLNRKGDVRIFLLKNVRSIQKKVSENPYLLFIKIFIITIILMVLKYLFPVFFIIAAHTLAHRAI